MMRSHRPRRVGPLEHPESCLANNGSDSGGSVGAVCELDLRKEKSRESSKMSLGPHVISSIFLQPGAPSSTELSARSTDSRAAAAVPVVAAATPTTTHGDGGCGNCGAVVTTPLPRGAAVARVRTTTRRRRRMASRSRSWRTAATAAAALTTAVALCAGDGRRRPWQPRRHGDGECGSGDGDDDDDDGAKTDGGDGRPEEIKRDRRGGTGRDGDPPRI
uniref:Uncharacterized protein n=1 Tax=Oryza sativa subsp. japonica TaxID=39947 RepID=Q6ZIZ2_ORYSJ|nr:hypothetical protein [Oryza sativa Japonica Group]